jgi:hypothetical protein
MNDVASIAIPALVDVICEAIFAPDSKLLCLEGEAHCRTGLTSIAIPASVDHL